MAAPDIGYFANDLLGCGNVVSAGSLLLVAPLDGCSTTPVEYTLTPATAGAIGDTSLSLTSSAANTFLRKGSILYFGTTFKAVTVAADTTVGTTATTVTLKQALTVAIATTDLAYTWSLYSAQAVSDIPITSSDTMVDVTSLADNLQGAETKTNVAFKSTIKSFFRKDDAAIWKVIQPASQVDSLVFAMIIRNGGYHGYGNAIVGNFSVTGATKAVQDIGFDLSFQPRYSIPTLYEYLSVAGKAELNNARRYAGLSVLT
jgi:hypothetical protein